VAYTEGTENCPAGTHKCAGTPVQVNQCALLCTRGTGGPCQWNVDLRLTPLDPLATAACLQYQHGTTNCPADSTGCPGVREEEDLQCAQFCAFNAGVALLGAARPAPGACQPWAGLTRPPAIASATAACVAYEDAAVSRCPPQHKVCADTPEQTKQCASRCQTGHTGPCQPNTDIRLTPAARVVETQCVAFLEGTTNCPAEHTRCGAAAVVATTAAPTTTLADHEDVQCGEICAEGTTGPCQVKEVLSRAPSAVGVCSAFTDGTTNCPAHTKECGALATQGPIQCAAHCAWGSPGDCQPVAGLTRVGAAASATARCVGYTTGTTCPADHKRCAGVNQLQPVACNPQQTALEACRAR